MGLLSHNQSANLALASCSKLVYKKDKAYPNNIHCRGSSVLQRRCSVLDLHKCVQSPDRRIIPFGGRLFSKGGAAYIISACHNLISKKRSTLLLYMRRT